MLKGLFPGTFDPPTKGHLQIILRAAAICDHLVVGIGKNIAKKEPILTTLERKKFLLTEVKSLQNVEIVNFEGLASDFARTIGANVLIRGLRSSNDLEFEKQMAGINHKMGLDTLFLIGDGQISSSLIRELAAAGAPLSEYIPDGLEALLHSRLQGSK